MAPILAESAEISMLICAVLYIIQNICMKIVGSVTLTSWINQNGSHLVLSLVSVALYADDMPLLGAKKQNNFNYKATLLWGMVSFW